MTADDKSSMILSTLSLIWEAELPFKNKKRRSPVFTFKNCEWYLELCVWGDTTYALHIVSTNEKEDFQEFKVKTYVTLNESYRDVAFFGQLEPVKRSRVNILHIDIRELIKKIPDVNVQGCLTILCIFQDADNSLQPSASGGQQSVHLLSSPECSSSTTGNQNFSLENLSKDLEALLDNKTLPDVQLTVEETSIPCHRAVLVARSSVFAAMFLHKMTESTSGILEIKDMDLATAEVFLKYLYSGKISDDLTDDMFVKLFEASDKYEVSSLKRVCINEMMKKINEENYSSYLILADLHGDQEFKDAVIAYIIKDDRLVKSEKWINFSSENPVLATEVFLKYVAK